MRTVTYKVDDLKKVAIHIGRAEENEATRVQIDAGSVFAEYPAAVPAMKVISPAGVTYSREVTRDGDLVVWDVVDSDLAAEGYGEMQLTFTENSVKVKSAIAQIRVCRSISGGTTPPDPVQDWLDEAEAALDAFPTGGTTGQVLAKKSNDDYDTEWVDQGSGGTTDYTDLTNKPQIGGVTLTGDKSLSDLGAASASDVSAKYTKPSGGIPATDIADGVIPDPEDLIDDTAGEGDTDKVWSADKTDAELADVKSAIGKLTPDATASDIGKALIVKTVADGKPSSYEYGEAGGGSVDPQDIAEAVDAWCDENITNPDSPPLDRSLTASSAAAPADMVGDIVDQTVSINMCDPSQIAAGRINLSNGTIESGYTNYKHSGFIAVDYNTQYVISNNETDYQYLRVGFYSSNSESSFVSSSDQSKNNIISVPNNSNVSYVRFSMKSSTTNWMMQEGTTPTEYEPYGKVYCNVKYDALKSVIDETLSEQNHIAPSDVVGVRIANLDGYSVRQLKYLAYQNGNGYIDGSGDIQSDPYWDYVLIKADDITAIKKIKSYTHTLVYNAFAFYNSTTVSSSTLISVQGFISKNAINEFNDIEIPSGTVAIAVCGRNDQAEGLSVIGFAKGTSDQKWENDQLDGLKSTDNNLSNRLSNVESDLTGFLEVGMISLKNGEITYGTNDDKIRTKQGEYVQLNKGDYIFFKNDILYQMNVFWQDQNDTWKEHFITSYFCAPETAEYALTIAHKHSEDGAVTVSEIAGKISIVKRQAVNVDNRIKLQNSNVITVRHGSTVNYPANTLTMYKQAFEYGIGWWECDILPATDGYVLCHDNDIYNHALDGNGNTITQGSVLISNNTVSTLKTYKNGVIAGSQSNGIVPGYENDTFATLQDFMRLAKVCGVNVIVEVKFEATQSQMNEICTIIKDYGMNEKTWILCYTNNRSEKASWIIANGMKNIAYGFAENMSTSMIDSILSATAGMNVIVSCSSTYFDSDVAKYACEHGITFGVWTILAGEFVSNILPYVSNGVTLFTGNDENIGVTLYDSLYNN